MSGGARPVVGSILLAVWLGGAVLFSGVVARAAFDVLPTRALAGALVGRVLPVVFIAGIVAGVAFVAIAREAPRSARIAAALAAAACAVAQLAVAPRIARLRESIGPSLDALAVADPRRIQFGRLHAISVGWLAVAMLAALVAIIATILAARKTNASPIA